ncbi:MAG: hypothetical protein IID03_12650 [Candidatus Dadabacteria bacterium]|nr:hypothetical protein [Candidatus Dadabacteria bacterium]
MATFNSVVGPNVNKFFEDAQKTYSANFDIFDRAIAQLQNNDPFKNLSSSIQLAVDLNEVQWKSLSNSIKSITAESDTAPEASVMEDPQSFEELSSTLTTLGIEKDSLLDTNKLNQIILDIPNQSKKSKRFTLILFIIGLIIQAYGSEIKQHIIPTIDELKNLFDKGSKMELEKPKIDNSRKT